MKKYCTKHKCVHRKSSKNIECAEFLIEMSNSDLFNKSFLKSVKNYDINSHKKAIGSKKQ